MTSWLVGVVSLFLLQACVADPRDVLAQAQQSVCECGADAGPPPDAARIDAVHIDASIPDAAVPDAAVPDATPVVIDAAPPDANVHVFSRLHLLGDSIYVYGATDTAHQAASILAASYPGVFVNQAVGGRSFYFYAYDATRRAAIVDGILHGSGTAKHPPPSELVIELGINDRGLAQWNATAFSAAYKDFVTRIKAGNPSTIVYCQTLSVSGTAPNAVGSSYEDYNAAIWSACPAGGGIVLDTRMWGFVRPADYYDSIHFNNAGHAKHAAAMRPAVGW